VCIKVRASKTNHQTLSISISQALPPPPQQSLLYLFRPSIPYKTTQPRSVSHFLPLMSPCQPPPSKPTTVSYSHSQYKIAHKILLTLQKKNSYIALKHKSHNPSSTTLLDPLFSTVILPPTPESKKKKKGNARHASPSTTNLHPLPYTPNSLPPSQHHRIPSPLPLSSIHLHLDVLDAGTERREALK